jgi:hypothetical protein
MKMIFIIILLCILGVTVPAWGKDLTYSYPVKCDDTALKKPMVAINDIYRGIPILVLVGSIESNSDDVVRNAIGTKAYKNYKEVWICSGGGIVDAGINIGRYLRSADATVRTPNGYTCASACTIATMGGTARIIDLGASFITHASSSFSGFGLKKDRETKITYYSPFFTYDCEKDSISFFCSKIRTYIRSNNLNSMECADGSKTKVAISSNEKCAFFNNDKKIRYSDFSNDFVTMNALFTPKLTSNTELFLLALSTLMKQKLSSELDLLKYFHFMSLNNTQINEVYESAYYKIEDNLTPQNVYKIAKSNPYHRSLELDLKILRQNKLNEVDRFAYWQKILTDSELSLKAQISVYIKHHRIDLGLAGKQVLKLYDAMRTCRIQSSCRLEPHTARALGYHSLYNH